MDLKLYPGILLASTNLVDLPKHLRPGRIDRVYMLVYLIQRHAPNDYKIFIYKGKTISIINIDSLVELAQGCSGAKLKIFLNEAMLLALRDGR
jgi:ATP-dependent 26S proteasome regulatory subunit